MKQATCLRSIISVKGSTECNRLPTGEQDRKDEARRYSLGCAWERSVRHHVYCQETEGVNSL